MTSILWVKLKRMRSDVPIYLIMMVMAIVLTFIFANSMFGGNTTQRVAIVKADESTATDAFLARLEGDTYSLVFYGEKQAEDAVAKDEVLAAIVIPDGFGDGLENGNASLELVKTADSPDIMALESTVQAAANQTAHIFAIYGVLGDTLSAGDIAVPPMDDVEAMYETRMDENAAVKVDVRVLGADNYDAQFACSIHYLMGYNIMFVMFSIIFTIGSILEDKKLNTWNRIRISPVSGAAVLAGNFIPTFLMGAVQMAIVFFAGQMLFGINLGNSIIPIIIVFAMFTLAVTCLGLLLATALRTYEQLNAATPVIIVATSMLGGCMWPLSIVSEGLRRVADFTPQRWALDAAEHLAINGGGLGSVLTSILVLGAMALVFFAVSVVLYNKKQKV